MCCSHISIKLRGRVSITTTTTMPLAPDTSIRGNCHPWKQSCNARGIYNDSECEL